ncbi:MAG: deoxyribose-phosphate aldolase [Candidatus Kapaibacterium sp.]
MSKFKELFGSDTEIKTKADISSKNAEVTENKIDYARKCVSFIDLTTLEGSDTFEKVGNLCEKGRRPSDLQEVSCAAICIYPRFISFTKDKLKGSGLKTASVATSFPSGQVPLDLKLQEVKYCIEQGADEIDMVISRGEFLSGNYELVSDEIKQIKGLCKSEGNHVHLKVILETGELKTYENIYKASVLAIEAGADFIKTSTGKISPAATLEAAYVMLNVIKEHYKNTGVKIGFKPAGGIRTTDEALQYVSLVKNVLGDEWLKPELFRIGASSLLDNLLKDIA